MTAHDKRQFILAELARCHVMFPSYHQERSEEALIALAGIFAEDLEDVPTADIKAAFKHHRRHGKAFPMLADIIGMVEPRTMYQMDNGPLGFGAVYAPDHPYVRLQTRVGTDLSKYVIQVRACDAFRYEQEARTAPPIELGEDEEKQIEPRAGFGFRRLGYDYDA